MIEHYNLKPEQIRIGLEWRISSILHRIFPLQTELWTMEMPLEDSYENSILKKD